MCDLVNDGISLVETAKADGITLRLFGGVAVNILVAGQCRDLRRPGDIDCVGRSSDLPNLLSIFAALGYQEDLHIRRLFGKYRRVFTHATNDAKVDLCLDMLIFSRPIDVRPRLTSRPLTLSVADLLLSKLQAREFSDKDVADVLNLLSVFEPGGSETATEFCLQWCLQACARDWGLYRLVRDNLREILQAADNLLPLPRRKVTSAAEVMMMEIENFPKTVAWKLRSIVGERITYWNQVGPEAQ